MLQKNMDRERKIGRYEILEELGYGGMASVYKAHDPQINRTLAIKILRPERCQNVEYRRRFLREAKAVGTLSHANIVTIYDIGEVENTPYIAMELLEGIPLDKLMKSDYQPTLIEILEWSIQLADALEYAHQRGIVHRDIKPSNIVLSHDKKSLKITDFGIAHFDESDVTQHTLLGEVLGTPQYMSPEQVLGKSVDARSDLFSVGVIMYQLFSGKKPFQADTLATLLFQIATESPEPIGQVKPDLPASIKQLVDKLLKKKPEKRFQTGAEFKKALLRIINDIKYEGLKEQSVSGGSLLRKWMAGTVLTLALVFLVTGYFLYRYQQQLLLDDVTARGVDLSQIIAFQSAEAVLSEDWPNVELFAQSISEQHTFKQLDIVDHNNLIRGSSNLNSIGKSFSVYRPDKVRQLGGARLNEFLNNDQSVYQIEVPVVFQTTTIGKVYLQLDNSDVVKKSRQFLAYFCLIALVVLATVLMLVFYFIRGIRNTVSITTRAMHELGEGNNTFRINRQSNDEFGQLYCSFDTMAGRMQNRDVL